MSTINTQTDTFASLGLAGNGDAAKKTNDASKLGLDTFLQLMVTQMNNQDPFEPMDNGDFLGQIAQFGAVSGLDQLNESFGGLSASLTSSQALQAGSLIGREVLAPVGTGYLGAGGSLRGEVDLDAGTASVVMRVSDSSGQLVREMDLGSAESGPLRFTWDGGTDSGGYAPPGLYNIGLHAARSDGSEQLETQLMAQVESVNVSEVNGLTLNLAGLGPVSFNSVRQIY